MGLFEWLMKKFSPNTPVKSDAIVSCNNVGHQSHVGLCLRRAKNVFAQLEAEDGNLLFSPVSLEMALGLLSAGVLGETRIQLLSFLGVHDYTGVAESLLGVSGSQGGQNGYKTALSLANSIWADSRYTVLSEYKDKAEQIYHAKVDAIDFSQPEKVASVVNAWCSRATGGMISHILDAENVDSDLGIVLCNALYFESFWMSPWRVDSGEFTNADGTVTQLDDMLFDDVSCYYETENAVAFSKAYSGDRTFLGILPSEGVLLKDVNLVELMASETCRYTVHAAMPKLSYDTTCENLRETLEALGVVDVFRSEDAKLGRIVSSSEGLFVSNIIQKCKIELDENGTKAAAVTVTDGDWGCAMDFDDEEKTVYLNRPFYYAILDDTSEQVLFLGRVSTVDKEVN